MVGDFTIIEFNIASTGVVPTSDIDESIFSLGANNENNTPNIPRAMIIIAMTFIFIAS